MDLQSQCKIAVLIPVYNNADGLRISLDSLMTAKGEFEVVIVDDGSTIPIPNSQYQNKPVHVLHLTENQGIARALNYGINFIMERGYLYLARLDCGDTISPKRFVKQMQILESKNEVGIVGSWVMFVDNVNRRKFTLKLPCTSQEIKHYLPRRAVVVHPAIMMRTSMLLKIGNYTPAYVPAEDYELFVRACDKGYDIVNIPQVLTICEINEAGISTKHRRHQMIKKICIQLKYFSFTTEALIGILLSLLGIFLPYYLIKKLNDTKLGKRIIFRF